jgi:hypothetical protein
MASLPMGMICGSNYEVEGFLPDPLEESPRDVRNVHQAVRFITTDDRIFYRIGSFCRKISLPFSGPFFGEKPN